MSGTADKVELVELAAQPTLMMRAEVAPEALSAKLAEILPSVFQYIIEQGLQPVGAPFTRYLWMTDVFGIEAGIPITASVAGSGAILAGELPAG